MDVAQRLLAGLGTAMVALVVIATTIVGGLPAMVPLVSFVAASAVFLLRRRMPETLVVLLFTIMAISVVGLYWLVSTSPLALFLLGALAAWREPRRILAIVLSVATAAHLTVQLALGQDTILSGLATVLGVAFFLSIGLLLVRERNRRDEVARLLREVELSRQAEQASYAMAERARMARDLHDVLAHTLSGLAIQLEGARLLAGKEGVPPALADSVTKAHRLARTGLDEARRAVAALRGERMPGPDQLPELVAEHRLSAPGRVRLAVIGDPLPLDAEAGLALYRTAQEALSNVRKHAVGASVEVRLEWSERVVVLTVDDGGSGEPSIASEPGYGLTGMSERAELLGASLEAGPRDSGYRVRLTVPLATGGSRG
jgi:signal transduction histidine kinase